VLPEQSVKDAKAYYNNKILALRKNLDELQPIINKKQENRETVVAVLQVKLSERDKQQQEGNRS
jgi:prefoldin alpha subunit